MTVQTDVERYYDRNTPAFARFGQGGRAIHRAVWAPGVQSRADAFRYVDGVVLKEIERLSLGSSEPLHVLDLGCGVGASLSFLASRAPIRGSGVTLSGVQAQAARASCEAANLAHRLSFVQADFLNLPKTIPPAQLAFAIEAFVHSADAAAFFAAAARQIVPGGLLIVCDDFLSARGDSPSQTQRQRRHLEEVRTCWLAASLLSVAQAEALAAHSGFERLSTQDLTPFLELRRVRDRAITLLVTLGRPFRPQGYRFRSLVGGNALQMALVQGLLEYRLMIWQKR